MPKINLKDGISLSTLASKIDAKLVGKTDAKVFALSSLEQSREGDLTFFNGKSRNAFLNLIKDLKASAVIAPEDFSDILAPENLGIIFTKDPYKSFVSLIPCFFQRDQTEPNISPKADVHPSAEIGKNVHIGAYAVIGENVQIEENTVIHPHVTIYNRVRIGKNTEIHSGASIREDIVIGNHCVIQNGAIIGADGFGYIPDPEKGLVAVPQIGTVELADYTEVGANTCIDRATLGCTKIGFGTKVDNLVQIGHNVEVGKFTVICGQVAIGGSTKIGNQVVIGGAAGVADHTEIVDGCRFGGLSGIAGKYTEKADYMGNVAIKASEHRRIVASTRKLPEVLKSLKKES